MKPTISARKSAISRHYKTLCEVLDKICSEAPGSLQHYHAPAGNHAAVIQARSRALLHLYLMAQFGLIEFADREKLITDGKYDGGIDAYYVDQPNKKIYLLQSKFRATAENFIAANMGPGDLLKMDIKRIVRDGQKKSEAGEPYNPAIRRLQSAIQKISNIGAYDYIVVLLGNSSNLSATDLRKLIDGYSVEQFSHHRIYSDLMYPVINGTYFNTPDLTIEINLENVRSGEGNLDYAITTSALRANIKVLFVPTKEIGRIMSTYKNSILEFNPRSFLELQNNTVNREIEKSLLGDDGNEFALFNNGITIISDQTAYSSNTARSGRAQIALTNPQLVNGGQTAFTLARIFERALKTGSFSAFKGKEVLVKTITIAPGKGAAAMDAKFELIRDISKASNSQTKVDEADRRSNDPIQRNIQRRFFEEYGYFYERKRGEFADGIHNGYISRSDLIDRARVIRISLAASYKSRQAKSGLDKHFRESALPNVLSVKDVDRYVYGHEVMLALEQIKKSGARSADRWQANTYGQALRYGEYAVAAVCINVGIAKGVEPLKIAPIILSQWRSFEASVAKKKSNATYMKEGKLDFISYYKGATVDSDLKSSKFKA